jgi:hypothetical protein
LAILIAIYGGASLLFFTLPAIPLSVEAPNVLVDNVAASQDGRVYFALQYASRVQIYGRDGTFSRAFAVDSRGGGMCVVIAGQFLFVHIGRRDAVDQFDLNGNSVGHDVPEQLMRFDTNCAGKHGELSVDYGFQETRIRYVDGRATTVIRKPWWHLLLIHPIVSIAFCMVGALMLSRLYR